MSSATAQHKFSHPACGAEAQWNLGKEDDSQPDQETEALESAWSIPTSHRVGGEMGTTLLNSFQLRRSGIFVVSRPPNVPKPRRGGTMEADIAPTELRGFFGRSSYKYGVPTGLDSRSSLFREQRTQA